MDKTFTVYIVDVSGNYSFPRGGEYKVIKATTPVEALWKADKDYNRRKLKWYSQIKGWSLLRLDDVELPIICKNKKSKSTMIVKAGELWDED